jgi:PAS domain S-box-containing protein
MSDFDEPFWALLDAAPDAMIGVDADGSIAWANAQAESLFGFGAGELVGRPVDSLVPERVRGGHPRHRAGYLADPRPRPMGAGMELAARRHDGSEFPAEISLSAIPTPRGPMVCAAVRDVTERVETRLAHERLKAADERAHLERQLQQSRRLESLGQLAGGVAHDFNNLLAAIMNYATLVDDELDSLRGAPDVLATVRNDIAQIRRAGERGAGLTHQLLAFGRREVTRPEVLDLDEVVADVEDLLRRTIGEHVELTIGRANASTHVFADRGQLEQVLVNLVVNARDAMPAGGTLTIDTMPIEVDAAFAGTIVGLREGSYVRLRVSDTGEGMPPEVVERAFEPFFTTKASGAGTGLGLATVYGIVAQAGGVTAIYSEVGHGTCVNVLLPTTDRLPARPPAPRGPGRVAGHETILVVEDEPSIRDVTRRILGAAGYDVHVAANGDEAIDIALHDALDIDLLLTDVVMPKMLGREVAERIAAVQPKVRVLFMSGYAQPVLASQGTLDPGVVLLEKPFTRDSLVAKIREVLDGAPRHR